MDNFNPLPDLNKLDPVIAQIEIAYRASGALSVAGNIVDTDLALRLLDAAKDAIRSQIRAKDKLIVPPKDVEVPDPLFKLPEP